MLQGVCGELLNKKGLRVLSCTFPILLSSDGQMFILKLLQAELGASEQAALPGPILSPCPFLFPGLVTVAPALSFSAPFLGLRSH